MSIVKPQALEAGLLRTCAEEIIAAFEDGDQVKNDIYGFCIDGGLDIFFSREVQFYAAGLAQSMALKVEKCIKLHIEASENYNPEIHQGVSAFLLTENKLRGELRRQTRKPTPLDRTRIYLSRVEDYTEHTICTFEADEKARLTKLPVETYESDEGRYFYPLFNCPQSIGLAYARQFLVTVMLSLYEKSGISPREEVEELTDWARQEFIERLSLYACRGDGPARSQLYVPRNSPSSLFH